MLHLIYSHGAHASPHKLMEGMLHLIYSIHINPCFNCHIHTEGMLHLIYSIHTEPMLHLRYSYGAHDSPDIY